MSLTKVLVRLGAASTGLATSLYLANQREDNKGMVVAREPVNDLYHGTGSKWDSNWDKREPASIVKPLKSNATDEEKAEYETKLAEAKPKSNRIIVMVRHGQYNLDGTTDSERYLTELGQRQAEKSGVRLGQLYSKYLDKLEEGNIKLVKSTMTRATETANIILKQLPEIENSSCDLIREGAPCVPDPPIESWAPEQFDFFQEGAIIEAGFRKYFHRADPSQEHTSVDILVCHGNVIRYCVCRALQFSPAAWLRMSVHNGSITVLVIKPSGRVSLLELGGAGHFPTDMLTFN